MAYTKTTWQDLPNTTTPVNAANLNKIEQGIYDNSEDIVTVNTNIGDLADLETSDTSSLVDSINSVINNVILWQGEELPAGKTYTLTDNIYNYRFAIIEGQWGNKFVIPIISGNNYFNGGMNYPLGNGTGMITTGLNASIVNDGLGISVTYFRQLTHNANSNHGGFENPQLYKIIGVR